MTRTTKADRGIRECLAALDRHDRLDLLALARCLGAYRGREAAAQAGEVIFGCEDAGLITRPGDEFELTDQGREWLKQHGGNHAGT